MAVSRVLLVAVSLLLALAVAHAAEAEMDMEMDTPVPVGFSLPNIFNPVTDRAEGREQAKALVNLVAKEPAVAFGTPGPEGPVEDMWNGEKDAESSANVAQLKMLREVDALEKLIEQGRKILRVIPAKEKRLALLKRKLSKILDAKAKREATEKLDQQTALLNAIKKREEKMSSRLTALKTSQNRLDASVNMLRAVIESPNPQKTKDEHMSKLRAALDANPEARRQYDAAQAKRELNQEKEQTRLDNLKAAAREARGGRRALVQTGEEAEIAAALDLEQEGESEAEAEEQTE